MRRSSCGLRENLAAGVISLLSIAGIAFLYFEKDSALVRFYMVQNFLLGIATGVLGALTCGIGSVVCTIFWIIQVIKAFQGQKYSIPVIGNWADKILA